MLKRSFEKYTLPICQSHSEVIEKLRFEKFARHVQKIKKKRQFKFISDEDLMTVVENNAKLTANIKVL